jgi:hypothetical protein
MNQTISLFQISSNTDFPFSPGDYSKFKFGDSSIGKSFGKALANKFIESYLINEVNDKQFIAYSSPYQFIPTATMTMFEEFVFQTNKWLIDNNRPILDTCRIYRNNTYSQDYGELSALERLNLIGSDLFYMDRNRALGKTLLLLDDIKITGSHEFVIKRTLESLKIKQEAVFLYFAELVNLDINPNFENFLNYFTIKSLSDLLVLMQTKHFVFNTRAVKYILSSNSEDLTSFLSQLADYQIVNIYNLALSNNYYAIPPFKKNMLHLRTFING